MKIVVLIGIGSFAGGILRYLLSQWVQAKFLTSYPYGTLVVNVLGCLIIGAVFAISERTNMSSEWRMFLATGLCGGFTTFSAFSNETFGLLRDGQYLYAITYVVSSILLGLFATYIGFAAFKSL